MEVLVIIFHSRLSMSEHILEAVTKAMDKCMALRKIRGVLLARIRQTYTVVVVLTKNHAALTWYTFSCIRFQRHRIALERDLLLSSRLISCAFKCVTMLVLQKRSEALLRERLAYRAGPISSDWTLQSGA